MIILFYISAFIAVLATFLVITRTNAVHALLYLIVSLLAVALIFFTLGAPFVAALEVIIYAGAIMVLFIFVIMMLNLGGEATKQEASLLTPGIWIGPSAAVCYSGGRTYVSSVLGDIPLIPAPGQCRPNRSASRSSDLTRWVWNWRLCSSWPGSWEHITWDGGKARNNEKLGGWEGAKDKR